MSAQLHANANYGKQNSIMLGAAADVYAAILDLLPRGITVLGFSNDESGTPVINVEASAACDSIAGGFRHQRRTATGYKSVMRAQVKNCQIEWNVIH